MGYVVHGLGFYHIPHAPLLRTKKESRMALISVVGGVLSKEQIVVQLQRIFPSKWTWELTEHDTISEGISESLGCWIHVGINQNGGYGDNQEK